jgi:hypothetical protein
MTTNRVPATQAAITRTGHGYAHGHHGEIFQGIVERPFGRDRRTLVTLPCSEFRSIATFKPCYNATLDSSEAWRTKALAAARRTLHWLGATHCGGCIFIESNIPTSRGFGSSTADVTATIRAVADAFCEVLPPQVIARLAVAAEVASDPIMFNDQVVLFAQREGVVLEYFGHPLPPLDILSIHLGDEGSGVDTVNMRLPAYNRRDVATFRTLLGLLRRAVQSNDSAMLARVASVSADINQRFLPKPSFSEVVKIVKDSTALGLQVAHSGSVIGILFRPGDDPAMENVHVRLHNQLGLKCGLYRNYHRLELP